VGSISLLATGGAQIREFSNSNGVSTLIQGLVLIAIGVGFAVLRFTVFRAVTMPAGSGVNLQDSDTNANE
jgi:multisubunit Na+/H+ antiporter MnhC subunit